MHLNSSHLGCSRSVIHIMKNSLNIGLVLTILVITSCERENHKNQSHTRSRSKELGLNRSSRPRDINKKMFIKDNIYLNYLPESLKKLAESDLPSAIDAAKQLVGKDREQAIQFLLMASARDYPEFVSREILVCGLPPSSLLRVSQYLISQWNDLSKALQWAETNAKGKNRGVVIGSVLKRLAEECPSEAFTFVENMGPGASYDEAFKCFVSSLFKQDARAALEYVSKFPNEERSKFGIEWVCGQWALSDPSAAESYLENSSGNEGVFNMAAILALTKMHETTPVSAIEWAKKLPGASSDFAVKSTILQWGRVDRQAAASFLEVASIQVQKAVGPEFIRTWTQRDPVAAGQWVSDHGNLIIQKELIAVVMNTWIQTSPIEASKWLGEMPSGEARDSGIVILVKQEMLKDPANTFSWIEHISDEKLRHAQMDFFLNSIDKSIQWK